MRHVSRRLSRKTLSKTTYVPEALPRTPPKALSKHPRNLPRVPECRARDYFPGRRASAPRVPELKPRPYPVDFQTALRVFSELATCPRVPSRDYFPGCRASAPRVPGSPGCTATPASDSFPDASGCATCPNQETTRLKPPAAHESPRKTLPEHSASAPCVDRPEGVLSVNLENSRKWF